MTLFLRPEVPADMPAIHALTQAAFANAPHASHTEHFIVDALRQAGALFMSLVADEDGVPVGHLAISPVAISGNVPGWYALGPIAVAPARQRQGIGSKLVTLALLWLQGKGAAGCVLVGDPAYYARFGFRQPHNLVSPGIPPEYLQLVAFSPSVPAGEVRFHEAFAVQG